MYEPAWNVSCQNRFIGLKLLGWLILAVILLACLFPQSEHGASPTTICLGNMMNLATITLVYAADADECLPPAQWLTALNLSPKEHVRLAEPTLQAANEGKIVSGYAMNWRVVSSHTTHVNPQSVLFLETDILGRDVVANLSAMSYRHRGGSNVAFADGHAKRMKRDAPLRELP